MPSIHDYMGKEDMADLWADALAVELGVKQPHPKGVSK